MDLLFKVLTTLCFLSFVMDFPTKADENAEQRFNTTVVPKITSAAGNETLPPNDVTEVQGRGDMGLGERINTIPSEAAADDLNTNAPSASTAPWWNTTAPFITSESSFQTTLPDSHDIEGEYPSTQTVIMGEGIATDEATTSSMTKTPNQASATAVEQIITEFKDAATTITKELFEGTPVTSSTPSPASAKLQTTTSIHGTNETAPSLLPTTLPDDAVTVTAPQAVTEDPYFECKNGYDNAKAIEELPDLFHDEIVTLRFTGIDTYSWCYEKHQDFRNYILHQLSWLENESDVIDFDFEYVLPTPKQCNNSLYVSVIVYAVEKSTFNDTAYYEDVAFLSGRDVAAAIQEDYRTAKLNLTEYQETTTGIPEFICPEPVTPTSTDIPFTRTEIITDVTYDSLDPIAELTTHRTTTVATIQTTSTASSAPTTELTTVGTTTGATIQTTSTDLPVPPTTELTTHRTTTVATMQTISTNSSAPTTELTTDQTTTVATMQTTTNASSTLKTEPTTDRTTATTEQTTTTALPTIPTEPPCNNSLEESNLSDAEQENIVTMKFSGISEDEWKNSYDEFFRNYMSNLFNNPSRHVTPCDIKYILPTPKAYNNDVYVSFIVMFTQDRRRRDTSNSSNHLRANDIRCAIEKSLSNLTLELNLATNPEIQNDTWIPPWPIPTREPTHGPDSTTTTVPTTPIKTTASTDSPPTDTKATTTNLVTSLSPPLSPVVTVKPDDQASIATRTQSTTVTASTSPVVEGTTDGQATIPTTTQRTTETSSTLPVVEGTTDGQAAIPTTAQRTTGTSSTSPVVEGTTDGQATIPTVPQSITVTASTSPVVEGTTDGQATIPTTAQRTTGTSSTSPVVEGTTDGQATIPTVPQSITVTASTSPVVEGTTDGQATIPTVPQSITVTASTSPVVEGTTDGQATIPTTAQRTTGTSCTSSVVAVTTDVQAEIATTAQSTTVSATTSPDVAVTTYHQASTALSALTTTMTSNKSPVVAVTSLKGTSTEPTTKYKEIPPSTTMKDERGEEEFGFFSNPGLFISLVVIATISIIIIIVGLIYLLCDRRRGRSGHYITNQTPRNSDLELGFDNPVMVENEKNLSNSNGAHLVQMREDLDPDMIVPYNNFTPEELMNYEVEDTHL